MCLCLWVLCVSPAVRPVRTVLSSRDAANKDFANTGQKSFVKMNRIGVITRHLLREGSSKRGVVVIGGAVMDVQVM